MELRLEYVLSATGAILLACFVAYLGYRSGVKSEKRKEFNEVADPLRMKTQNLQENLTNPHISPVWPEPDEFKLVEDRCSFWQRKRLKKAVENYRNSIKHSCGYGEGGNHEIWDEKDIQKSLKGLLKCLRRK